MRSITGRVILPANTPAVTAEHVLIEVRDVSLADVPSTVVAEERLDEVILRPNGEIEFDLPVPDVAANRTLALRVHVDIKGTGRVDSGDLLTTVHYPVPSSGASGPMEVRVAVV